ncbi:MAG: 5-dehydro-2-deoxygluconokinase [Chloroflexi bacterium]|uniref:5-dehydro-2-deoxygluconokinase n=2 Tax=Candidatus Thermofonsia Clade 3 TaxID=2364209 RepID=A0A2M8QGF1_9CHLR|nr:MAG: 5-dehydro-2-deoxygluconokinase [Candidatus Thermofonsia Clade 3 bacterium]RMG64471.1 MAG: 5-dehydro-2-deoxygluconokinase [Chloroflexota bacterium]
MGRSSIDLYSADIGAPFVEITRFAAFVGGSPTNVSVGARRLGLRSVLLTAVGEDLVGDFILNFLKREGVETQFIPRKPGHRTSAVLLGIEPPDRFPLVYYRDNCADMELTIDDVLAAPIAAAKVFQFAGTNLYKDPCRSATLFAAELARRSGVRVVLDVDFRPDQWHDPRAFGVAIRSALHTVDIVIATDDELNAAMLTDPAQMSLMHSQVSDARVRGDVESAIRAMMAMGVQAVVRKRGLQGSRVYLRDGSTIDADAFPVEVVNILGAGDAFAAGFLYGYVHGWGWHRSARLANACGAILVTKHGCANFMPTLEEAMAFANSRGGL